MNETTTILLDGRAHAVPRGSTLADLIAALGHEPKAVTSAVDGVFVARDRRGGQVLRDGAVVALFKPITGG